MFERLRKIAASIAMFNAAFGLPGEALATPRVGPVTRQQRRAAARAAEKAARRHPQRTGLAHRICERVLLKARPRNLEEGLELLRRLPRNRAEARRYIATKGALARA